MKIGRCVWEGQIKLASINEETREVKFLDASLQHGSNPLQALISGAAGPSELRTVGVAPLDAVQFLSPFSSLTRNVFAVGKNYKAHAIEFDKSGFNASSPAPASKLDYPQFFSKATTTLGGPTDPIRFDPAQTQAVDYEGEVGVVIGKVCRNVARQDAMDCVFGFVLLNDVTARDLQKNHVQWFLGKSLDTFCPLGPWVATREEVDIDGCGLRTWVNGELRQDAKLADLIFDIPTLITTLSATMTLLPGDIIATGTPEGVGIGFTPPRFLKDGDIVKIAATGLGEMSNTVETPGAPS